jgi:hypothetical protein
MGHDGFYSYSRYPPRKLRLSVLSYPDAPISFCRFFRRTRSTRSG